MNAEIAKAADNANKAYNRYVAQLRREGFAKKEASYLEIDEDSISPTARVLRKEYKREQAVLDAVCGSESASLFVDDEDERGGQ